jgi:hypothetical protein
MLATAIKSHFVWMDRFETPSVTSLLSDISNRASAQLFEHARTRLLAIPDVREELAWLGLPWRWAFSYWNPICTDRALAYLIPDPNMPRLAVPLEGEALPHLTTKRISKSIRDAIIFAPTVNGVRWCQWDIAAKPVVEDALGLLQAMPHSPPVRT